MVFRGCIGNFSPSPLHSQLKEYAIVAATEDERLIKMFYSIFYFRFNPIDISEYNRLSVHVSLLHSFEKCDKWNDWIVFLLVVV